MIIRNLRNPHFPDHIMPPVKLRHDKRGVTLIEIDTNKGIAGSMYRVLIRHMLFSKNELIVENAKRSDKKKMLIKWLEEEEKYA